LINKYVGLTLGLLLFWPQLLLAANLSFESTSQQVGLLELYTSEGCSSCPAAEHWLNALQEKDGLWHNFIPIALHVDYWDYIGWKDRFASPHYSETQWQYAREKSLKTVYTPGFVYNGREWHNFFEKRFDKFPKGKMPGILKMQTDAQYATVQFIPKNFTGEKLQINLVLLGFELETDITAGENRGKKLPHDFVVLGLSQANLMANTDHYKARLEIPGSAIKSTRYGIAAWINNAQNQTPVQAVGGWLR